MIGGIVKSLNARKFRENQDARERRVSTLTWSDYVKVVELASEHDVPAEKVPGLVDLFDNEVRRVFFEHTRDASKAGKKGHDVGYRPVEPTFSWFEKTFRPSLGKATRERFELFRRIRTHLVERPNDNALTAKIRGESMLAVVKAVEGVKPK